MKKIITALSVFTICITACTNDNNTPDRSGWSAYASNKDGNRYSSNEQINSENVSALTVAWTFSSGDKDTGNHSQNQCNPIIIDGVLYGTSPKLTLFALDAATGQHKWNFYPSSVDTSANNDPFAFFKVNRGEIGRAHV